MVGLFENRGTSYQQTSHSRDSKYIPKNRLVMFELRTRGLRRSKIRYKARRATPTSRHASASSS